MSDRTSRVRLFLTRHGETVWNRDGERYCGRTEISLTERGVAQAERLGRLLTDVHFDAAYCSPRDRARNTLERMLRGRSIPLVIDERLREMDYGAWEGLRAAEISAAEPEQWAAWRANSAETPAGKTGETGRQVWRRAKSFLSSLRGAHRDQSVLVVGHSTFNRVLIAGSLQMPLRHYRRLVQSNAALSVADVSGKDIQWLCLNQSERLPTFD